MTNKAIGSATLALGLGAMAYIALTNEPRLPSDVANGVYWNRCCGSVRLDNGVMVLVTRRITYTIERDKEGAYLLPEHYIGVSAGRIVVRQTGHPLKLRLDDGTHPHRLRVLDDGAEGRAYDLTRKPVD